MVWDWGKVYFTSLYVLKFAKLSNNIWTMFNQLQILKPYKYYYIINMNYFITTPNLNSTYLIVYRYMVLESFSNLGVKNKVSGNIGNWHAGISAGV